MHRVYPGDELKGDIMIECLIESVDVSCLYCFVFMPQFTPLEDGIRH